MRTFKYAWNEPQKIIGNNASRDPPWPTPRERAILSQDPIAETIQPNCDSCNEPVKYRKNPSKLKPQRGEKRRGSKLRHRTRRHRDIGKEGNQKNYQKDLGTDRKANPLPNFRSSEKTPATITSMSKSSHMNHKGPEDTVDMRYWAASAWAKSRICERAMAG